MKRYSLNPELVEQLPRTFVPAIEEQVARWDRLFPSEQRLLEARFEWLGGLSKAELDGLFAPVKLVEARMNLPRRRAKQTGWSIEDVAVIARSPVYPEWREQVEKAFTEIDSGVERSGRLKTFPRLVVCTLPAGLPAPPQPWSDFAAMGFSIRLAQPFGEIYDRLLHRLAERALPSGLEPVEGLWAIECDAESASSTAGAIVLHWSRLGAVRRAFLDRLNTIRKTLEAADQTTEDLRRMDIAGLPGVREFSDLRVREFIRELLLSGNGALIFNNSFVQWGAAETLRRVQPQVLFARFGIRAKPKPFSSIVLFEDQKRSNPVRDQPDIEGSLIDGVELSGYVHLATQRLAPYNGRTLTLLTFVDKDEVFVIEPKRTAFDLLAGTRANGEQLTDICLEWLGASV